MAKSPSHALPACMNSCSRAKDLPPHLTGQPARTSHVASTALRSRSPNGLLNAVDWRCGRAALERRVKFIKTSSSLRGPTSSISTTSLSCQHIDDLSSIALGLQICGHPLSSAVQFHQGKWKDSISLLGKQRHRVAVRDWKTRPFTRHVQGGWERGGSSTREGSTRTPAWQGASRRTLEHLEERIARRDCDIDIRTQKEATFHPEN